MRGRAITLAELYTRINSGFNLLFAVIMSVVFLAGVWFTSTGELSLGTLVLFLLYIRQIQVPVATLGGLRYEMLRAARAFDRVFEVLNSEVPGDVRSSNAASSSREHAPAPAPNGVESTSSRAAFGPSSHRDARDVELNGSAARHPVLVFDDVRFRYRRFEELAISSLSEALPPSEPGPEPEAASNGRVLPWVLDGVSFSVGRGELVAVVGASGAGKSTIALLAAGLYQPTAGRVQVDGRATPEWAETDLARRVALITQDTYVLHDTVRANLRYVNEGATDEELAAACEAAHLGALIASLPDGYDTLVGERGYRLSGGERQRLAVARALLKDADLIILDEPTSQLDAETELLIKQTTEKLFASKAVLTIAHRLSTIVDANRILVLSGGVIVEEGTHDALMGLPGGRYAALYRAQVRGVV
jgi:ATP-binding cassette subfamily B protein